jgi:hypothetical protein
MFLFLRDIDLDDGRRLARFLEQYVDVTDRSA